MKLPRGYRYTVEIKEGWFWVKIKVTNLDTGKVHSWRQLSFPETIEWV